MDPGLVSLANIEELLRLFAAGTLLRTDPMAFEIQTHCEALFNHDYNIASVSNEQGQLCSHYPPRIIIIESERITRAPCRVNDAAGFRQRAAASSFARTRARFAVPVLVVNGKNICRSSTLARRAEIESRQLKDRVSSYMNLIGVGGGSPTRPYGDGMEDSVIQMTRNAGAASDTEADEDCGVVNRHRLMDIMLLKSLGITYILDLMTEGKKIKFGLTVTSSEKVDRYRYSEFLVVSVPYPGVELFGDFHRREYQSKALMFDWTVPSVDAVLNLPQDESPAPTTTTTTASSPGGSDIDWVSYRTWDIVQLTQNYLKLFVDYIRDPNKGGLLIHCISGWDRTPLFISLLRLSLWADGDAHASLQPQEILFLTIAYDWFLFGHWLSTRLERKEEIFYFCFEFLQHITSTSYSLNPVSCDDSCIHFKNEKCDGRCTAFDEPSSHATTHTCASSESSSPSATSAKASCEVIASDTTINTDSSWQFVERNDEGALSSNITVQDMHISDDAKAQPSVEELLEQAMHDEATPLASSTHHKTCTCKHYKRACRLMEVRKMMTSIYFQSTTSEHVGFATWLKDRMPIQALQDGIQRVRPWFKGLF